MAKKKTFGLEESINPQRPQSDYNLISCRRVLVGKAIIPDFRFNTTEVIKISTGQYEKP